MVDMEELSFHISPRITGWALRKDQASKASKIYPDIGPAIIEAMAKAADAKTASIFIHRNDGTVERFIKIWKRS